MRLIAKSFRCLDAAFCGCEYMEIRVLCQVPIAYPDLAMIRKEGIPEAGPPGRSYSSAYMEKAAIVATAKKRPKIFRALKRSLIHRVAMRTLTTKLSWVMGVTTLTSALPRAR